MIECVQYSFERNERISINNNDSDIQLLIHYPIEWYHDLYVILFITHKIKNVNISLEILGQFVFFMVRTSSENIYMIQKQFQNTVISNNFN